MNKFSKIMSAVTVAVVAIGLSLAAPLSASATETCTPKDAWSETVIDHPAVPATYKTVYQRYSWTGGPTNGAPTTTPPSGNWQANTTNYAGAGHGTDPVGTAFQRDKPGKGHADWFFWTSSRVIDTPAVAAKTHVVEHDAVVCAPVVTPPPTVPPAVTPPVVTPPVVTPPTVVPPVTHVTPPTTEVLAHTGATTGWLIPVGSSLLLVGAGLLLRRKLFV